MELRENIRLVRERVAAAAREAGRDPGEITLVAATKTQSDGVIREVIAAGVTACGENRVQERTAHLKPMPTPWRIIILSAIFKPTKSIR